MIIGNAMLRRKAAQALLEIGQRCGIAQCTLCHDVAEVEQVHVAVVEAGADEASAEGDDLVLRRGQGEHLRVRADGGEAAVLHNKGLL